MWVKRIDSLSNAKRRRLGRRLWLISAVVKRHPTLSSVKAWLVCRRRNEQNNCPEMLDCTFAPAVTFGCSIHFRLSKSSSLGVKRTSDKEALRIQRLNLQLYERNQSIVQENERLRKQALLLSEENQNLQQKLKEQLRCRNNSLESS